MPASVEIEISALGSNIYGAILSTTLSGYCEDTLHSMIQQIIASSGLNFA